MFHFLTRDVLPWHYGTKITNMRLNAALAPEKLT